jgi:hypothetical protein
LLDVINKLFSSAQLIKAKHDCEKLSSFTELAAKIQISSKWLHGEVIS